MRKKHFKIIAGYLAAILLVLAFFIVASYSNTFGNIYLSGIVKFISFFITGLLLSSFFTKYQNVSALALFVGLLLFVLYPFDSYRLHITLPAYLLSAMGMAMGFYFKKMRLSGKAISFSLLFILIFVNGYTIYPLYVTQRLKEITAEKQKTHIGRIDSFLTTTMLTKLKQENVLSFSKNKVYLIEFFFDQCPPCKAKRIYLQELEKKIDRVDLEILYIESGKLDNYQTYSKNYTAFGGNVFYDADDALITKLGITGFPFEIIIDKNGKSRYSTEGFDGDFYGRTYINETQKKINQLIYE